MMMAYGLLISLVVMLFAWIIYLVGRNSGIVDVFWGMNILLIGSWYLYHIPWSSMTLYWVVQLGLILWAGRLSLFLYITRVAKKKPEKRYDAISQNWEDKSVFFLIHYLFQGLLAWLIAMPFFVLGMIYPNPILFSLGCILVCMGLFGETLADWQLHQWIQKKSGLICEVGFWRYSRHPNYFFECMIWLGFSLMPINGALISFLGLVSIATLATVMRFASIPITEKKSLEHRGKDYADYQSRVSCFIPWVPKRSETEYQAGRSDRN